MLCGAGAGAVFPRCVLLLHIRRAQTVQENDDIVELRTLPLDVVIGKCTNTEYNTKKKKRIQQRRAAQLLSSHNRGDTFSKIVWIITTFVQ